MLHVIIFGRTRCLQTVHLIVFFTINLNDIFEFHGHFPIRRIIPHNGVDNFEIKHKTG